MSTSIISNRRALVVTSAALILTATAGFSKETRFSEVVSSDGTISLSDDFRKDLVHLGSWFVPEGDASGFHDVYADANAVAVYREDGVFPDGAVIVKELRASVAGDYTTGQGVAHATSSVKQWFVMVKDSHDRFPNNANWGSGWGWALFKPDTPSKNVSGNYQTDCLGCHVPAQANDYIYVEAYPTLTH